MAVSISERLQAGSWSGLAQELTACPTTVNISSDDFVAAQATAGFPSNLKEAILEHMRNDMILEALNKNAITRNTYHALRLIQHLKTDTLKAIAEHPKAFADYHELILLKLPIIPLTQEDIEAFSSWPEEFQEVLRKALPSEENQ